MPDLLKALRSGRVLLMDGAIGTELLRAGAAPAEYRLESLNATHPELVRGIHRSYVDAGADVLLTNTFQLFADRPVDEHQEDEAYAVGAAAIAHARHAAVSSGDVLLDIGPTSIESCDGAIVDGVILGWKEGVDGILLETCTNSETTGSQIWWAQYYAWRQRKEMLPLFVSWAFHRGADGLLANYAGESPKTCARLCTKHVAALGINCGTDIRLTELLEILDQYRAVTHLPLFVRPNAGTPKQIDGQWVYPETPESMAAWLPELFKAGVVMIGGCCGTTPAYIAVFRKVVDEWNKTHHFLSNPAASRKNNLADSRHFPTI